MNPIFHACPESIFKHFGLVSEKETHMSAACRGCTFSQKQEAFSFCERVRRHLIGRVSQFQ
jgi:hypothetical protein